MNFLIWLALAANAGTIDPLFKGCWQGRLPNGANVSVVLTGDKDVADALWYDDGRVKTLTDIFCKGKSPLTCNLSDDGGKFTLHNSLESMKLKFRGKWIHSVENPGESRVEIRPSKIPGHVKVSRMSEPDCDAKVAELRKTFGVGP